MATQPLSTRDRLVAAASTLFYAHGIRAIGVDAIAAKAGVTKRTLYYHFASKDELVAAYLAVRDTPNLGAVAVSCGRRPNSPTCRAIRQSSWRPPTRSGLKPGSPRFSVRLVLQTALCSPVR
jgi:hypothetical protein